ncbi:alkaline phosphatase D family protein [Luteimonas sp. MJ174]|uniref:alkaline phosphatase D family protein n=1 Tax=Luteimonas sp. MJ174 TaxID=3129237 RepID=UPI0031B9C517
MFALSGDADTGSNHQVFNEVLNHGPLFFIHLGDLHYEDIAVNDVGLFLAAYDTVLAAPRQAELYRQISTLYMWDDHDSGPDDGHGGSPGRDAACEAYRQRVPHPPLVESGITDAIYFVYEVGRVMFIFTDQRSMASPKGAPDNASKSILGAAQKAWFKGLLSDPANGDKLFVWVCSRVWGGVPTTGADHWGGFTTERREIADHVKAHCAKRFCVLSADMHSLAIDAGSNHDFATGGGAPMPTFQASPLDRRGAETYGGAAYSQGGRHMDNGLFGTMEITDTGGGGIGVSWKGYNTAGSLLVQYDWAAQVDPVAP